MTKSNHPLSEAVVALPLPRTLECGGMSTPLSLPTDVETVTLEMLGDSVNVGGGGGQGGRGGPGPEQPGGLLRAAGFKGRETYLSGVYIQCFLHV